MKKTIFALAALGTLSGVAHAESNVTLYGVLDVAIGGVTSQGNTDPNFPATVNPVSANHATTSVTGMFNGGIQDSRWGLKGAEDLGNGMKAIFTLESGIDLQSGTLNNAIAGQQNTTSNSANSSLNGQLFNRQSWVGLTDAKLGTLTFGRSYSPIYDIVVAYDPVQAAQLFSPLGFSGSYGGGAGVSEDTRLDNNVKYINKIGDINFGASYKFGGVAGNTTAGTVYTFSLGYEHGPLGVQATYLGAVDSIKTGGAAANTATATAYNNSGYMIAAKYKLNDVANIKAGYEHYTLSAASDLISTSTMPSVYGVATSSASSYTGSDQNVNIYFVGGDYNVTPALNVAAGYYVINLNGYDTKTGVTNTFVSLLADYSLSKRTDVYAGAMFGAYSDTTTTTSINYNAAGTNSTNAVYAVGIRHKF